MTTPNTDPTAHAIREARRLRLVTTDPTAGETARARNEGRDLAQTVTDPTDPRNGTPLREPA